MLTVLHQRRGTTQSDGSSWKPGSLISWFMSLVTHLPLYFFVYVNMITSQFSLTHDNFFPRLPQKHFPRSSTEFFSITLMTVVFTAPRLAFSTKTYLVRFISQFTDGWCGIVAGYPAASSCAVTWCSLFSCFLFYFGNFALVRLVLSWKHSREASLTEPWSFLNKEEWHEHLQSEKPGAGWISWVRRSDDQRSETPGLQSNSQ